MPKLTMPDAITNLKTLSDRNPSYEIKFSFDEEGPENNKQYTCVYRMGKREIGTGVKSTNQKASKVSAAEKAWTLLKSEGYKIWCVLSISLYAQYSRIPGFVYICS
jgi:hypothetical protein